MRRTKDVILQLSDFLRYVLYDTVSDFIPLEKEVEIIKTYVELQKARDPSRRLHLYLLTVEGNFGNRQIYPFVIAPVGRKLF